MAFADSIRFNGKSIRDFLTEIIEVRGRGIPRIRRRSSRIIGRHGEFTFGQVYDSRIIKISGYVEGGSHATLMLNIDEIKNLFKMDDQILATGDESISDGVRYGKLEFGDESDRYYRAIYNGTYLLSEISHQWFTNDLKKIEIEFRCDDPFAYATSLSESTMAGSADEFKVFDLGTAENEVIIELNGSVTNPVIVEGDKVGVAHFDYNDDLTDVEVNTVAGNFEEIFGFRTRKSLTSQQSKAIQIVSKDSLFYDRGTLINSKNRVNFNPNQGTLKIWFKPYWDGDDGIDHILFIAGSTDTNEQVILRKTSSNKLQVRIIGGGNFGAVEAQITVNSTNFGAGTWHNIILRWDANNTIDASSNTLQIDLNDSAKAGDTTAIVVPDTSAAGFDIIIGQSILKGGNQTTDGLIYTEVLERAITDSELTDLYNSGAGVEPFVTPDTKLLSAGELSGGLPVSVQYPWVDNIFTDGDQEVDPSSEWLTSAGTVVVTNETTIVKYDLQSAKLVWTGASSNEHARFNVVLDGNQDYFYRLWVYAGTLNASDELHLDIFGASTVIHTRRLDTGVDDMGVSYATGKWLYFEGTFDSDGFFTHQFRIRKQNANGNATIYIDQMDVQLNKVNNAPLEGTYVGGIAPSWVKNGAGTAAEENVLVHTGSSAQKYQGDSVSPSFTMGQNITLPANTWHILRGWLRKDTAGTVNARLYVGNFTGATGNIGFPVDVLISDSYQLIQRTFKTGAGTSGGVFIAVQEAGVDIIFDDITLIELDEVTANAASAPTPEIDSYSEEKFGQGLRIGGADTLSWAVKGNKNEASYEVWVSPQFAADWDDDTDDPVIFTHVFDGANFIRLSYDWTNDQWVFTKRAVGSSRIAVSGVQTFIKGQRLHIIGTYGSNGVNIFVDTIIGSPNANTAALSNNPITLDMTNTISVNSIPPDSIIDEIYVYSRELSQQEVTAQFNKFRATKNDNAKIAMTKVLATNDKLRIDTENELIEFLDSSGGTFTNAIASMDAGSNFFKMRSKTSVIYNKVALTNVSVTNKIKLNYLKRFL